MSLRIIFGTYRNKEIKLPKDLEVRPTLIRARRMIFDIIRNKYESFSFLDVFAGSGIMGFEALSNGANKVIFFDINKKIIKNLYSNIEKMPNFKGSHHIIHTSSLKPPEGSPIDIIFIDPPYDKFYIIKDIIKKLIVKNWINENSLIIVELPKKEQKYNCGSYCEVISEKIISRSAFQFLKYNKELK